MGGDSRAPTPATETLRALASAPPPAATAAGQWCSAVESYRERAERVLTSDGELARAEAKLAAQRHDWAEEEQRRQVVKREARVATRRAEQRLQEAMAWSRQLDDRRDEGWRRQRRERPKTAPAEGVVSSRLRRGVASVPPPAIWPPQVDREEAARKVALGMISAPPSYPPPLCPPPQSGKEARIRGFHLSSDQPPPKADGSVPVIDLFYYTGETADLRFRPQSARVLTERPPEPPSAEGWRGGVDRIRHVQERNKGPLWLLEEDRAREAGVPVPIPGHDGLPPPFLDSDFPAAEGAGATLVDMMKRGRLFRGMGLVTSTPY